MDIVGHKLTFARWAPSANHGGKLLLPAVVVTHYTGGVSIAGALATLSDATVWGPSITTIGAKVKRERRSAHLVIGRSGEIVQLVAFDTVAWHAGKSVWRGKDHVNLFSIGIELDNAGPLEKNKHGQWSHSMNRATIYPDELVCVARHKSGGPERGWHTYTKAQLDSLDRATTAIVATYGSIVDGAGHEDISPGRKTDPGPAFPMHAWRSKHFPSTLAA